MLIKNNTLFSIFVLVIFASFSLNSCNTSKRNKKNKIEENKTTEIKVQELVRDTSFKPNNIFDYNILNANINNDVLSIEVSYIGGCGTHNWDLIWSGMYMKSLPMKAPLYLNHEASNENCNDKLNTTLYFNLSPLKLSKGEKLILLLKNYDNNIEYILNN